jgi:hypothetical protein
MRAARYLLSISLSFWMVGTCLLGCTSTAVAAAPEHDAPAVANVPSCHMARHTSNLPNVAATPRGMMQECPLVVNATAATSKSSGHVPDPGRVPVVALPLLEKTFVLSNTPHVIGFLPNRGPTHLRCCVFLI